MLKNKVLILPSWYATPEAPTSGSFFREQAELMNSDFDVRVLVSSKRWISSKRYLYEKYIHKYNRTVSEYFVNTPPTYYFEYDFIKAFSDERNFEIEIENYCEVLVDYFVNQLHWKPDLIHAHSAYKAGIIAMCLAKELSVPYCVTEHLNPFRLNIYDKFLKRRIVGCLENADKVLAVSNHQKQHILMNEIDCNPIVVGNLVNEKLFSIKNDKPEIFTVVLVTYYPNFIKDVDTYFRAIALLQGKIKAIIVGGGEQKGEYEENIYEKMIKQYGISDCVEIVPKATRQEMNDLYGRSHALVSTSIAESFGVAICEAMLCGLPVVVTANGGCSDYMIDGVNGYIVPIKDPEALAEKILLLKQSYKMFDPNLIRHHIVEKYGSQAFKNRITTEYNKLISINE